MRLPLLAAMIALCSVLSPPGASSAEPFTGFGNTALDRKPGGVMTPSPFLKKPGSPATTPAPVATSTGGTGGIVLSNAWSGTLAQSGGGHTMKIANLRVLLSGFGKADADLSAHPDFLVYEGQVPGGAPGAQCQLAYLTPLAKAEALLGVRLGVGGRAVVPGFPDGLFMRTYDIRYAFYSRLTLLLDSASQVVALQLKGESVNWYAPTPFRKIVNDWHVIDYVNTVNRGQPSLRIDTRVMDMRARGYLIINTTGGDDPRVEIPAPGVLAKPAVAAPKQVATWYAPVPLVSLILYCVESHAAP